MGAVATHKSFWAEGESMKTGSSEKRERMAEYVEWLLTPAEQREPKTKTALADQMGVSLQTLRNYAKEAWVQRELASRARGVARVDRLPDILDTLYTQAHDAENPRSVQAAKVYLDWLEKTSPIREGDIDVQEMSDERLIETALELLQRASEKGDE